MVRECRIEIQAKRAEPRTRQTASGTGDSRDEPNDASDVRKAENRGATRDDRGDLNESPADSHHASPRQSKVLLAGKTGVVCGAKRVGVLDDDMHGDERPYTAQQRADEHP